MAFGTAPGFTELIFSPIDSISAWKINNGEVRKIANEFLSRLLLRNLSQVLRTSLFSRSLWEYSTNVMYI